MSQAIVDVIRASSSVPRPVRQRGVSQLSRFVDVEVRPVDLLGKLGRLARGRSRSGRRNDKAAW
jgi:hypothetical protein